MSFVSIQAACRLIASLAMACLLSSAYAQSSGLNTSSQYIASFLSYVHWPDEERIPIWTICIVGSLPSGEELEYANRIARGKRFVAQRLSEGASTLGCQVIDLTAAKPDVVQHIILEVGRRPVLMIGNGSEFCSAGGQICLHPVDAPTGFGINLSTMHETGLTVSSRLLRLTSAH